MSTRSGTSRFHGPTSFPYEKLAAILTFVTTTNELTSSAPTNKLSFLLMKPTANRTQLVKQEYRKGCCSLGGTLIIGGLRRSRSPNARIGVKRTRRPLLFGSLRRVAVGKNTSLCKIKDSARLSDIERTCRQRGGQNKFALSTKFISFTKHVDDRFQLHRLRRLRQTLQRQPERKRVLTPACKHICRHDEPGMVARKIDLSKSDVLPHLSSHEDVGRVCVAVVCLIASTTTRFFKINNASKNLAVFSHDYSHIDKATDNADRDKIVDLYTKSKRM